MKNINILVKPASGRCNIKCEYCFYRDELHNRSARFPAVMSRETSKRLLQATFSENPDSVTFVFQGGEPTVAGIDFFREFLALEKELNTKNIPLCNSLQTNGIEINDEWCALLKENNFLVGLSLDGDSAIHNKYRRAANGSGTFNRVLDCAALFNNYNIEYNILSVITANSARNAQRLYSFFRKNGFYYLQFIPCIEPIGSKRSRNALTGELFGNFLIEIFDLWYRDLKNGIYISIRHFDNWLNILLGGQPESCGMNGRCSIQLTCESDGGIYPCDFYVLDEWRLGDVYENTLDDILNCRRAEEFIKESLNVPSECAGCEYYPLCRNGCKRDRIGYGGAPINIYCKAYKEFFRRRMDKLIEAAKIILQMKRLRGE